MNIVVDKEVSIIQQQLNFIYPTDKYHNSGKWDLIIKHRDTHDFQFDNLKIRVRVFLGTLHENKTTYVYAFINEKKRQTITKL